MNAMWSYNLLSQKKKKKRVINLHNIVNASERVIIAEHIFPIFPWEKKLLKIWQISSIIPCKNCERVEPGLFHLFNPTWILDMTLDETHYGKS